jgi:uncharacterized membrane protein (UPF0136 family)
MLRMREVPRVKPRIVVPMFLFSFCLGAAGLMAFPKSGFYFLAHSGVTLSFEPENTPASVLWNRRGLAVGGGAGFPLMDYLSLAGTLSASFFGLDRVSDTVLDEQGTTVVIGTEAENSRVLVATADLRFSPSRLAEKFHPIITVSAGMSSMRVGEVEYVAYNRKTRETSRIAVSGTGTTANDFVFSLGMGAEIRIFERFTPLAEVRIPLTHTQYLETRVGVKF